MKYLWIDPEVFSWNRFIAGWSEAHAGRGRRSYAHWNHADRLLRGRPDEFRRRDLVAALKRAVDFRSKLIHEIWRLKDIRLPDLPKGQLDRLAYFEIVRPRQLIRLINIRNAVEHHDASPPDVDTCADFVDVVWYFLRSTDALIDKTTDQVYISPGDPNDDFRGCIEGGPEQDWKVLINLHLEPNLVSDSERADWITVKVMPDPFMAARSAVETDSSGRDQAVPRRGAGERLRPVYGSLDGPPEWLRKAITLLLTPF